jgi:hypothetical protein
VLLPTNSIIDFLALRYWIDTYLALFISYLSMLVPTSSVLDIRAINSTELAEVFLKAYLIVLFSASSI